MDIAIQLINIFKSYGNSENQISVLNNINLTVYKGELLSIVGPSGSGKSTLMNIMGCLDLPNKGKYLLNGVDVCRLNERRLSSIRNLEIGFVFQEFNLIPELSAAENVELPLVYRGIKSSVRKKVAIDALNEVGLGNRIYHRPSELSGGQRQRVAIARTLAATPNIILADEPTGNLDSTSGKDIINILLKLNHQGKTIIIITHDSKVANRAFRKIRVNDGIIVEDSQGAIA